MTIIVAAMVILAAASPARADATKCERAIVKAGAAFLQAKVAALTKCEIAIVSGKLINVTDCHSEPKTAAAIGKAASALGATIDKACGGDDKRCGGDLTNEISPATIGFPPACPNVQNGACGFAIADCAEVVDCVECIDEAAVDQSIALTFVDLHPTNAKTQKRLNKCQQTIGKTMAAFAVAQSKALGKCWDTRLAGKHANTCPDPGDGKAVAAIAKAETTMRTALCKGCAGGDADKNGLCDPPSFDPQTEIGVAAVCPAVVVPGGRDCNAIGALTKLDDLIACLTCVSGFDVGCADRSRVPVVASYPPECNGGSNPTPTATTTVVAPTTTQSATPSDTPTVTPVPSDTTTEAETPTPTPTMTPTLCFAAGTLVATRQGPRAIEDLRPGDLVLSFDGFTGKAVERHVHAVEHKRAPRLMRIDTASGAPISVTPDHYFWVVGSGWVRARELRSDDRLLAPAGVAVAMRRIDHAEVVTVAATDERHDVYNLVVDEFDNYFVGAEPVRVHSCPLMGFSGLPLDAMPE